MDGGLGEEQRLTLANVNISILDVNNKPPYFAPDLYNNAFHVEENTPVGHEITTIQAEDPDTSAKLRYSIDNDNSVAKNELGVTIPVEGRQYKC